jgi:hypothetical protein
LFGPRPTITLLRGGCFGPSFFRFIFQDFTRSIYTYNMTVSHLITFTARSYILLLSCAAVVV